MLLMQKHGDWRRKRMLRLNWNITWMKCRKWLIHRASYITISELEKDSISLKYNIIIKYGIEQPWEASFLRSSDENDLENQQILAQYGQSLIIIWWKLLKEWLESFKEWWVDRNARWRRPNSRIRARRQPFKVRISLHDVKEVRRIAIKCFIILLRKGVFAIERLRVNA
jgi:hypothetical protein